MAYEDRTLVCVQCSKEFTFTAGEQEFYDQKGLQSDPKRCKPCRTARRGGKRQQADGIYRSPAFENSAPRHQQIRGRPRGGGPGGGRGQYRSPGLNDRTSGRGDYRSPAFRDQAKLKPEQEYRAPGFREYDQIDPKEEYRSPGFQEHADLDVSAEYRAPGYADERHKYLDEKPMFSITCSDCGEEAMVPFLPEEKENPLCKACHQKTIPGKDDVEVAASTPDTPPPTEPVDHLSSTDQTADEHSENIEEKEESEKP